MATERIVIVDGTSYELPKAWGDADVESLMVDFRATRDDYVHVTLDSGVLHVLMTEHTQVRFVLTTPRPARQSRATIL